MTEHDGTSDTPTGESGAGWMEKLLRLTGPRPPVPPERMSRVKAAVRSHWRSEVALRSRRRRLWAGLAIAASLAAVTSLVILRGGGAPGEPPLAGRVDRVVAGAWSLPSRNGDDSPRHPLSAGEEIRSGVRVVTGSRGRLALRLGSGHALRLDERTEVQVVSDRALVLDRGAVYVDSGGPVPALGSLEIRTVMGTIRDLGTQFEVRWVEDLLQVRVREGSVRFGEGKRAVEVGAGSQLRVEAGGAAHREALERAVDPWPWIGEVAPAFPIDGQPLHRFLSWIQRERGLALRFGDPELLREAPSITLKGSIDGLTTDQALESVLATCGLAYRIEGATLVIERPPASSSAP